MAHRTKDSHCAICRWLSDRQPGQDLPGWFQLKLSGKRRVRSDLHETEKKLIAQALAATNGNGPCRCQKKLGISRRTLHRKN